VHDALSSGQQDFVLLDVRGTEKYAAGHVEGALDLAHRKIIGSKIAEFRPIRCSWCIAPDRTAMARPVPPCGWRNWAARSR
jgi:rhodanese-related sulfurtransferase